MDFPSCSRGVSLCAASVIAGKFNIMTVMSKTLDIISFLIFRTVHSELYLMEQMQIFMIVMMLIL